MALVDIENLHGQPRAARAGELGTIIRVLRRASGLGPRDHIVIGCNPGLALTAAACWPSMRLVTRRGPDGADLALLRCVDDPAFIARRYDQVVIGSGDGIFEQATIELLTAGVVVHIYSRPSALSWRLRRLGVTHPLYMPLPPPTGAPLPGPAASPPSGSGADPDGCRPRRQ